MLRQLHDAICARPDDDTAREALARAYDPLDAARGAFIRAQLARARLEARQDELGDDEQVRCDDLRRREAELLHQSAAGWLDPVGLVPAEVQWSRGLPENVSLSWERLWLVGRAALGALPVRHLHVLGPWRGGRRYLARQVQRLARWPALPGLESLTLTNGVLEPRALAALSCAPGLAELAALTLTGVRIGSAGAATLATTARLPRLRALTLQSCDIGPAGCEGLAASPQLAGLHALGLWANRAGDRGAVALASAAALGELRALTLSGNRVGPVGAVALLESTHLVELRRLDLSVNPLGDEGVARLGATRPPALDELELGDVGVGSSGLAALARSTLLGRLRVLRLPHNFFGAAGVRALTAVPHLERLEVLDLSSNSLEVEAMSALTSVAFAALRTLDLTCNRLGSEGVRALTRARGLAELRELDLTANSIGDEGAALLAGAAHLPRLRVVRVDHDTTISAAGLARLRARFGPGVTGATM